MFVLINLKYKDYYKEFETEQDAVNYKIMNHGWDTNFIIQEKGRTK